MFHIPLNIVPRNQWNAVPPISEEALETPVENVISTFTGSRECFTKEDCTKVVQELQLEDIKNGHPDIRFNFLIGGDGTVFEGRGSTTNCSKVGSLLVDYDGQTMDIAYIGPHPVPYQKNYPSLLVKLTEQVFMGFAIEHDYISSMYNIKEFSRKQSNHYVGVHNIRQNS